MSHLITNTPIADIKVGDEIDLTWHVSAREAQLFNIQSPPEDPYAQATNSFGGSLLIKTLLSQLFNQRLPGPGSTLVHDELTYHAPINLHDDLVLIARVTHKHVHERTLEFSIKCHNKKKKLVCDGSVTVKASKESISLSEMDLPEAVLFNTGFKFKKLMTKAQKMGNTPRVAVVHPMNAPTLEAAIMSAKNNLIIPVFVAPLKRLEPIAKEIGINLSDYTCVDVPYSHAAAKRAVEMARNGEVDALMKGSLHTDELMHEVLDSATGIKTDKRISHCFVMDIPTYPLMLTITDAAINIAPDLISKQHIVQNAIDLLHALGNKKPKVGILSAVETVNPKMPSTIDAAALCKMADRGQIKGGILDGPLAFDNAISRTAANIKGIDTPIAGVADILLVPDLDAGNMLVKQLAYLTGAIGAGIVLGAKVPIILTSRADLPLAREASCALVKYFIAHEKKQHNPATPQKTNKKSKK